MTVPQLCASAWKTSCFVWMRGSIAINDLTDEQFTLSSLEQRVLSDLRSYPAADPGSVAERLAVSSHEIVPVLNRLADRGLLVPAGDDESRKFSVHRVDIEASSHCNARCQYCPVSIDPKPKRIMPLELFRHIVSQVAPYRPEWVSLNSFSEPLLDPLFIERCRYLEEAGLKVALFTNATVLKPAIRAYLGESRVLHSVVINFASANPQEWAELMGLPVSLHTRTVENMIGLAEVYKGPISISVHGHNATHRSRRDDVCALFARFPHVTVVEFPTNTMAGYIGGELVGLPSLTSVARLAGCNRLSSHLQISWCADVFMCCLDYTQEIKFGNLRESSIDEILSGEIARNYRRQVYGLDPAEANLLCRKCCHIRTGH